MRQIWIEKFGAPDVLKTKDAPDPTPSAGEMRVEGREYVVGAGDVMHFRFNV